MASLSIFGRKISTATTAVFFIYRRQVFVVVSLPVNFGPIWPEVTVIKWELTKNTKSIYDDYIPLSERIVSTIFPLRNFPVENRVTPHVITNTPITLCAIARSGGSYAKATTSVIELCMRYDTKIPSGSPNINAFAEQKMLSKPSIL